MTILWDVCSEASVATDSGLEVQDGKAVKVQRVYSECGAKAAGRPCGRRGRCVIARDESGKHVTKESWSDVPPESEKEDDLFCFTDGVVVPSGIPIVTRRHFAARTVIREDGEPFLVLFEFNDLPVKVETGKREQPDGTTEDVEERWYRKRDVELMLLDATNSRTLLATIQGAAQWVISHG